MLRMQRTARAGSFTASAVDCKNLRIRCVKVHSTAEGPLDTGAFIQKLQAQKWIENWKSKQQLLSAVDQHEATAISQKADAQNWINNWKTKFAAQEVLSTAHSNEILPDATQKKEASASPSNVFLDYAHLWSGLGMLYVVDYISKKAFLEAGLKFPSSLVGMFAITTLLIAVGEQNAAKIRGFFAPALDWIAKWLSLFYVASLVTLPLALKELSGSELVKIAIILSLGMVGTLIFTAQAAVFIRDLVKTPTKAVAKAKSASPYLPSHYIGWGALALASLAATLAAPGTFASTMAVPFCLACTVSGYLLGNALPSSVQGVLHPVVMTALAGNAGAALFGAAIGVDYESALKIYYSKGVGAMGAGDVLMSLLGSVILSMGFRIYDQRDTMKRHAPEILGATLASALFSFFSTALAAKALGLQSALARALIPRSVTVALALPIAGQLDAPLSIAAASVLLHCLMAANFGPALLTALGYKDTISRGLAAAGTGGGFGTAALTSKEPEALPFCALSYSMVGIISTMLATIPQVRNALVAIVG